MSANYHAFKTRYAELLDWKIRRELVLPGPDEHELTCTDFELFADEINQMILLCGEVVEELEGKPFCVRWEDFLFRVTTETRRGHNGSVRKVPTGKFLSGKTVMRYYLKMQNQYPGGFQVQTSTAIARMLSFDTEVDARKKLGSENWLAFVPEQFPKEVYKHTA
jgi:hypothetical protein